MAPSITMMRRARISRSCFSVSIIDSLFFLFGGAHRQTSARDKNLHGSIAVPCKFLSGKGSRQVIVHAVGSGLAEPPFNRRTFETEPAVRHLLTHPVLAVLHQIDKND